MSIPVVVFSWLLRSGKKVTVAYSSKVDTPTAGSACTTSAPSNNFTSYNCGGGGAAALVRHFIKSDFLANRKCSNSDSEGGYG
jgi:hypothetical protein